MKLRVIFILLTVCSVFSIEAQTHVTPFPVYANPNDTEYNIPATTIQHDSLSKGHFGGCFPDYFHHPQFSGGDKALFAFLRDHIHYPDSASVHKIEGTVYIQFKVNADGSISDIKVLKGVGGGCTEEALRAVQSMPKWVPYNKDMNTVPLYYTLPINFSLSESSEK